MQNEMLQRGHVTKALSKALSFPLGVLTAPMGYGKTTAARALMRDAGSRSFYVAVPQGAESAGYVWNRLWGKLVAQGESAAAPLRDLGFPRDAAETDRVLERIRGLPANGPVLLILDDYHCVRDPEFDAFIGRLARENIPGLSLFLFSRTRPELFLDELLVKGLARLFGQDLLAFSEAEAVAYFALHGIRDARAAREARRLCEGWPAALWLSAQGYKAGSPPASALDVGGLLERVIFPQYEEREQRLLMRASLLDSFTPREAAAVADEPAAPRLLEGLEARNAFVSRDADGAYRLHSMLRSFLKTRLEAEAGPDKPALYRRAGECRLEAGDMLEAARFFSRAGRDEDLLRLLEIFTLPRANLLLFLFPEEIIPLVMAVPRRLRMLRPMEYLTFIYFCFAEADALRAVPLLEEAEAAFAADAGIAPALKRRLAGEIALIHSLLAFNDLYAMRDCHAEAHRLLHGRSGISSRHMIWNFGCPHSSYLYLREPGTYAALVELVEGHLHYFQDLADGCSAGAQLVYRAEFLLERGEFTEVEQMLMAAIRRAESREQITTVLAALFSLARLYAATGREDEAAPLLREKIPEVAALGHVDLSNCLDLALGYIHARLGDYGSIPAWLREGDIAPSRNVPQMLGFIQAVHGMAALEAGDWSGADVTARNLPAYQGPFQNLFGLIHAEVLAAVAAERLYGPEKALKHLRAALDLARPDGIALSIAEYGGVLPLLLRLRPDQGRDDYLETVIGLAGCLSQVRSRMRRAGKPDLTPRQREIMRLVAEGGSNEMIAERLGLSSVTVKKILSTIYTKLRAKNRAEAVRRFSGK